MKSLLPLSVFVSTFLISFAIQRVPGIPKQFVYFPDLVIGCVASFVVVRLIATKRLGRIPLRYVLLFSAFCYVVISGALVNHLSPEVLFAGLRTYFKYVPLFLLPFAYDYSDRDIKYQFVALLCLGLLQIPVSFYQRFIQYRDSHRVDVITGTLAGGGSGTLSIVLVSMVTAIIALYLGKRISVRWAFGLGLLLLLPTTINETKVTPILLLIGGDRRHLRQTT